MERSREGRAESEEERRRERLRGGSKQDEVAQPRHLFPLFPPANFIEAFSGRTIYQQNMREQLSRGKKEGNDDSFTTAEL